MNEMFNQNGYSTKYGALSLPQQKHSSHVTAYLVKRSDDSINQFYSRPSSEISRGLVEQANDNRAHGWSNE